MSQVDTGLRERLAQALRDFAPGPIVPLLRELKYRFGDHAPVDRLQAEVADLQRQWDEVLARTVPAGPGRGPHVLFVTGFGVGTGFLTKEPILMMSLHRRGCRISSLFCDVSLPACEFNDVGNHLPAPTTPGRLSAGLSRAAKLSMCHRCATNVRSTYSRLPVELWAYHQFLSDDDLAQARAAVTEVPFDNFREFVYRDIQVGDEVFASVLRVTFKGTVEDTPLNRTLVSRFLLAGALMTHAAENALRQLAPDSVVVPHGVYINHGITAKVGRKLRIPVVVYPGFGGIRKDAIMISHNESYHRTLVYESNEVWEHADLTPEQRQRTLAYALSKKSGGVDMVYLHQNAIEDASHLYTALNIDRSRPIVSLYTNVIWDGQIFYGGKAFENILEWMRVSIEELAKNDRVWGVIRIHPAEIKGGLPTRQPFIDEINKWFPRLPANIRVIPADSDLSSYTLAEQSRAAIIYGTKMGLEIALRGVPVLVCGESFSRGKGFTIDVTSKQHYAELIRDIHLIGPPGEAKMERAIKYAHYLYFRKMIDFPYLTVADYKTLQGKRLTFSNLAELDSGRDANLDLICNAIMHQGPAYLP